MSRQHWIDEFFRKRMERRTFPVENGEFEEVRALLHKRNGTGTLMRGGRFSKWWLSALIPVAGLLWWAFGSEVAQNEMGVSQVAEQRASSGVDVTGPIALLDTSARLEENASQVKARADATISEIPVTADVGQGATVNALSTAIHSTGSAEERRGVATMRSSTAEGKAVPDQGGNRTEGGRPGATPRSADEGERPDHESSRDQVADGEGTPPNLSTATTTVQSRTDAGTSAGLDAGQRSPEALIRSGITRTSAGTDEPSEVVAPPGEGSSPKQVDVDGHLGNRQGAQNNLGVFEGGNREIGDGLSGSLLSDAGVGRPDQGESDVQNDADNVESTLESHELLAARSPGDDDATNARSSSGTVNDPAVMILLLPRWPQPPLAEARRPIQRSLEVIKFLSAGELHVFGAPLNTRTRTSDGKRSGAEAGSLFGFEYRVRVKRFAWSTGIFYGSYVLKADQGATDVQLSFVEVPLLASVKLVRGRFGLMMQGGMSMDLLFNSGGRYPLEEDRTTPGFPSDAFRTANYSWLLRPQATYHVNEHLSVSAGPLWKAQLGEVAKEGPLNGAVVSSSGVIVGLSWRLERTTY